jgi:5'-nucleotidase / UDP-sugar diphosphatase
LKIKDGKKGTNRYVLTALLIIVLCLVGLRALGHAEGLPSEKELLLLFTHDLHSYFLPHRVPSPDGSSTPRGGYARLAALIKAERKAHQDKTLLVDAGDFSMGTLFHTLFMTEALELRLMGRMGYEVSTLGNHDFDFHNDGLAAMLKTARAKGRDLPALVASNVVFSRNDPKDNALKEAFRDYPVKEYLILERNGLRIGLFGLLGRDAAEDTPFAKPVTFADVSPRARRIVDILKKQEKVDLVVCLSHTGTSKIKKRSEDEALAREVSDIDVIISGHTHTVLPRPIIIGKTTIVSAGSYGEYLGLLSLSVGKDTGARLVSYELKKITADLPEDPETAADIEAFQKTVDREYLSLYHLKMDQAIAESVFDLESLDAAYAHPGEMGLGNLITDAYRKALEKTEGRRYAYVNAAIVPLGLIRGSFQKGKITVADAFQVLSLGLGTDGRPGYPLLAFYVYGREIKDAMEVETSVAPLFKKDAHLQVSGIRFAYNPYRIWFDRVTAIEIQNPDGSYKPLDPNRLYRVCANLYTTQMIAYISRVTHGILKVVPKDAQGTPLTDLKQAIVYINPPGAPAEELKEWLALTESLQSFNDKNHNGLPEIPDKYRGPQGRIRVEASLNPVRLIGGGSFLTYGALAALFLILALIGVSLRALFRKKKRP